MLLVIGFLFWDFERIITASRGVFNFTFSTFFYNFKLLFYGCAAIISNFHSLCLVDCFFFFFLKSLPFSITHSKVLMRFYYLLLFVIWGIEFFLFAMTGFPASLHLTRVMIKECNNNLKYGSNIYPRSPDARVDIF